VCCNGNSILKAFKPFISNILPPGTYSHKQRGVNVIRINPYPANLENMVSSPNNTSKWQMGFNALLKG
jgi:hypothetical protein